MRIRGRRGEDDVFGLDERPIAIFIIVVVVIEERVIGEALELGEGACKKGGTIRG